VRLDTAQEAYPVNKGLFFLPWFDWVGGCQVYQSLENYAADMA